MNGQGYSVNIRAIKGAQRKALFAEALADGLTIEQAARSVGKDYSYGNSLFQRIRKELGPQAI